MKKFILTIIVTLGQLIAYAQYTIDIQGSIFNIELNDDDMTATIRDYMYKIDDSKYPVNNKTRKFKNFDKERTKTIFIPDTYKTASGKEYTITTIGKAAFAGYSNMDYIVIPSSITTIEDYAFFRTSLISAEIPASVQSIGNRVFGWCTNLKNLKLPQGVPMGNGLYTESKGIDVTYYTSNDFTESNKKVQQKRLPIVTSSDVDVDLPSTSKQNDEMFAVIIANEQYKNVANVDYALNDGRMFQRYCQQVLGIPSDNIHIAENATYGQMVEEINWVSRIATVYDGDAKILIYYAGHGIPNEKDGTAYLLPVDVSGDNTAAAYSLNNLYSTLGGLNVKNVTLFMDACFSGSQRGDGMLTAARGVAIKAKSENPLGNMVVFSATQGDETAHPYAEKGHGLFTYFLLKKLKETKGSVNYGTLGDYIRKEVSRRAVVVNNKPQTPTVSFSSKMNDSWRSITFK